MSDPSAEPARPSGPGAILLIALGLMVCAVLAAFLILSRGGRVDGAAVLESALGVRGLGEKYTIVEAREMPSGTHVVILDAAGAAPETPPEKDTPPPDEIVDWRTVKIPAATTWPRRVVFTLPKQGSGQAAIDAFFVRQDWGDIAHLGPQGGKTVVATKKLAWRGFDADFVHERAYERKLTFRDAVSVDLSLEKQPCVLTAFWPRGEAASEEIVVKLLAELGSGR
jgi:hypothetical protein